MADFNFSVFNRALGTSADASELVGALDRELAVTADTARWEESGAAFKFASSRERVAQLNARNTCRGHSGKFIPVYPRSDDDAVRLAEALHNATVGLAGPRILSDRPYAPGRLVHYRYGAFVENRRLTNDGSYTWVISDPDGNPVEDRHAGQYLPPAWVRCPFPEPAGNGVAGTNAAGQGGVLVADRFPVREAIRHVNKGGVYRAVDTHTQADVILREARPHVAADDTGKDVRDLLRVEARALEQVAPLAVLPGEHEHELMGAGTPGYAASGILAFLLRLQHRSSRLWMVDPAGDWSQP